MKEILKVEGLSIKQSGGCHSELLVDNAYLQLQMRRPLTLIGESGCGKSLIGQAVIGLVPNGVSAIGRIMFNGENVLLNRKGGKCLWGRELFLFPQEPGKYLNPLVCSLKQVAEVYRKVHKKSREKAYMEARRVMRAVGLTQVDEKKYPWQLSGGMGQRLLTAITMAEKARVVVADEPTKGLDSELKYHTVELLKSLSDSGKALLVITHDLEIPELLGGDLAVMYGGRIVEMGTTDEVLSNPRHPYSIALKGALPKNGLNPVPRKLNRYSSNEDGCVFLQRCLVASPRCTQKPALKLDQKSSRVIACHHCSSEKSIRKNVYGGM